MWAKWIGFGAALGTIVVVAAAPATRSGIARRPTVARSSLPGWIYRLPQAPFEQPAEPGHSRVIATATNGQQLLASRSQAANGIAFCFQYGSSGGGGCSTSPGIWEADLSTKQIALLARMRDRGGHMSWWGILGDDVRAVRVRFADGSKRTLRTRYGFSVLGNSANPARSVTALDSAGAALGTIDPAGLAPTSCNPAGDCDTVFVFKLS